MTQFATSHRLLVLWTTAALAAIIASSQACRWREGRSVFVPYPDADLCDGDACPDGDGGDSEEDGDERDDESAGPRWIEPADLLTILSSEDSEVIVVDIRSLDRCEAGRIPGARCLPWVDDHFVASLDVSDEEGWLVFYDDNGGETCERAAESVGPFSRRVVAILRGGFAAWDAWGYEIETGG